MADTIATITLRSKLVKIHESRRLKKSFDYLRQAVGKMSKVDPRNVHIDTKLNEYMMVNPSRRMARMEVKIAKEGSNARVSLAKAQPVKATAPVEKPKVAAPVAKSVPAATKTEKPKAPKPASEKPAKSAKPKAEEAK